MSDTAVQPTETRLRWYQGVPRYAWLVLFIAALGWLLDCMDQNLFTLVRQPSVKEILQNNGVTTNLDAHAKEVGGQITMWFLIGWAVGGFTFGILGDKLGRTRTMMITILIYAAFTGLNGFVQTPWQYAACRFLTALGVGGEFAAGASLVAEVFPERSRAMALGLLQSLSAVGNMTAAALVYFLRDQPWNIVYFIGAAPALLVLWIRSTVKEPEKWQHAKEEAEHDGTKRELGNIADLFLDPVLRRNTIAGVLLATAGVGGMWGVGFFLPDLTGSAMLKTNPAATTAQLAEWRSIVFFIQNIGAGLGMFSFAALSERVGRKPAMFLFFTLAFLSVQGTFHFVVDFPSAKMWAFVLGFCALAPFAAYCVYFPELFPTRLRATGVGFCYNCARILAAFAPFVLGSLSRKYADPADATHGLRVAASIVAFIYVTGFIGLAFAPETRGKPLPE